MFASHDPKKLHSTPHLYQKRGFYYYRYRVPKIFCAPGHHPEIRLSLRTSYQRQAQKYAIELHAITLSILTTWNPGEQVREQVSKLRIELQKKLDTLLSATPKSLVPIPELKNRLDKYLEEKLEK